MTEDVATTTLRVDTPPDQRRPGRITARGKFLYEGDEMFYVRGVTYGPFRPRPDGSEYHGPESVEADFSRMRQHGFNAVRTYTPPPTWLLDAALRHGLRVMVGLPWEQHVTFLDDHGRAGAIEAKVREMVRPFAGHPALLGYAVGNEIPPPIVRWHGRRRVERFIGRLYHAVKREDPDALVTYVNYPTTEYLQLPFLDFAAFNVYLEHKETYEAYLARLQNLAGDGPLVMAEIGLDSRRNGEGAQAASLDWQVRAAFGAGCAGTFAFKWTDEWHRGGVDIEDWDFGLTDRQRRPKPALDAVRGAYAEVPFSPGLPWPRVSVAVCSYNGAATIGETLDALRRVDYPDFEVIVVDDGSTDDTARIAQAYEGVRLIRTENRGLSAARNVALEAATGEIVAYLDDDAYPVPQWLCYLASSYLRSGHLAMGGPNIAPPGDGIVAEAVARAPGNPTHVLLTDTVAEHIPGCNFSARKDALVAIGGFDPRFRIAGDDVDACWRLQERGTIGFSPAAMVWHHRRRTLRTYWCQQKNYGKAEAMLEDKWPERYNALGHLAWGGLAYGTGVARALPFKRWRVYYGVWGTQLFQSLYERAPGPLLSLPLMPEWYLVIASLAVLSVLGVFWTPLLAVGLPLLLLAAGVLVGQAVGGARLARAHEAGLRVYALTVLFHLVQPLARLVGRLGFGLHPWRGGGEPVRAVPQPRTVAVWSETWTAPEAWVARLDAALLQRGAHVCRGGSFDRWDLEVRGGLFAAVRVLAGVEEHGGGKQLVKFRLWPRLTRSWLLPALPLGGLAAGAALGGGWVAAAVLGAGFLLLTARAVLDGALAAGAFRHALSRLADDAA